MSPALETGVSLGWSSASAATTFGVILFTNISGEGVKLWISPWSNQLHFHQELEQNMFSPMEQQCAPRSTTRARWRQNELVSSLTCCTARSDLDTNKSWGTASQSLSPPSSTAAISMRYLSLSCISNVMKYIVFRVATRLVLPSRWRLKLTFKGTLFFSNKPDLFSTDWFVLFFQVF